MYACSCKFGKKNLLKNYRARLFFKKQSSTIPFLGISPLTGLQNSPITIECARAFVVVKV